MPVEGVEVLERIAKRVGEGPVKKTGVIDTIIIGLGNDRPLTDTGIRYEVEGLLAIIGNRQYPLRYVLQVIKDVGADEARRVIDVLGENPQDYLTRIGVLD